MAHPANNLGSLYRSLAQLLAAGDRGFPAADNFPSTPYTASPRLPAPLPAVCCPVPTLSPERTRPRKSFPRLRTASPTHSQTAALSRCPLVQSSDQDFPQTETVQRTGHPRCRAAPLDGTPHPLYRSCHLPASAPKLSPPERKAWLRRRTVASWADKNSIGSADCLHGSRDILPS